MMIYFGSSRIIDTKGEVSMGSGLWYRENNEQNTALKIELKNPTCQIGELAGICWAVKMEPLHSKLHLTGNSELIIHGLMRNLCKWEAKGYIWITYKELFRAIVAALRARTAPTTFQWIKAHCKVKGNEKANALAKEGAAKIMPDELDLNIDPKLNLTGAKLLELSQALAYEGICEQKHLKYKRGLDMMLDIA